MLLPNSAHAYHVVCFLASRTGTLVPGLSTVCFDYDLAADIAESDRYETEGVAVFALDRNGHPLSLSPILAYGVCAAAMAWGVADTGFARRAARC